MILKDMVNMDCCYKREIKYFKKQSNLSKRNQSTWIITSIYQVEMEEWLTRIIQGSWSNPQGPH